VTAPLGRLPGEARRPHPPAPVPRHPSDSRHTADALSELPVRLAGRRAQPSRQVAHGGLVWPGPIPVHHGAAAGTPPSTSSILHTRLLHQIDLMYSADRGVNESSCPGVRVLGCPSAAIAAADRTRGQRLPGRELVTLVSEPHNLVSYQAALAPRRRAVRMHQQQRPLTDRRGPATPPHRHPPLKEIQP